MMKKLNFGKLVEIEKPSDNITCDFCKENNKEVFVGNSEYITYRGGNIVDGGFCGASYVKPVSRVANKIQVHICYDCIKQMFEFIK